MSEVVSLTAARPGSSPRDDISRKAEKNRERHRGQHGREGRDQRKIVEMKAGQSYDLKVMQGLRETTTSLRFGYGLIPEGADQAAAEAVK